MSYKNFGFYYTMRGVISNSSADFKGFQIRQEQYTETSIFPNGNRPEDIDARSVKILNITEVAKVFGKGLGSSGMFNQNNAE